MKIKSIFPLAVTAISLSAAFFSGCTQPEAKEKKKEVAEAPAPAGDPIYEAEGKWDNQNGDTITLSSLKGKIPVVSMVFTRCTFACPRIVSDLKAIEKQVPEDKKDDVVFVLVSFDSDRDHTKELQDFVRQNKLGEQWMVLHGDEESVRELSMLLDVKYKKQPNGDFTHSSSVALLDRSGAIVTQLEGLGADARPLINAIKTL